MTKHKDKEFNQQLFDKLQEMTASSGQPPSAKGVTMSGTDTAVPHELRKMKKFRFQLLHRWLVARFAPCCVADIAGGKGLLAYLLQESGWQAVVVDPHYQDMIDKYKDINTGQRIRVASAASVPHLNKPFTKEMGEQFDLLVGMHAHGCTIEIIDAATQFGSAFVLFPCCVIGEPFVPPFGEHWLESVTAYALQQGHTVIPFRLNFRGQNIGLYGVGKVERRGLA